MHSFFIDQDTALKNEDVTTVGQLELVCEIYSLYSLFTRWVRKHNSHQSGKSNGDLFYTRLSQIISDICKAVCILLVIANSRTRVMNALRRSTLFSGSTRSSKVRLPAPQRNSVQNLRSEYLILCISLNPL